MAHGRLALINDKRERKAAGSYYTPDRIVEYIVEHAVGPVLRAKLDALRPAFRAAQKEHRRFPAGLMDQFFDFRVLDPAMGSGHFLVKAVDFITNKMLDFLNSLPGNPVIASFGRTRRLSDVNLLKRHVLQRCIYGVDLDPMAVELAKVSLWLDCFTPGASLVFLDHHIRCGNSLIGSSLAELEQAGQGRLALLDQEPIRRALRNLLAIGQRADATLSEVAESRQLFAQAQKALEPCTLALDGLIAGRFGVEGARALVIEHGGCNKPFAAASLCTAAVPAAGSGASRPRRGGRDAHHHSQRDAGVTLGHRKTLERVRAVARAKRFFHWEMAFPEAFFELAGEIRRKPRGGFDAIIGNPPYLGVRTGAHEPEFVKYARAAYSTAKGNWDIFGLFLEKFLGEDMGSPSVGMIVPTRVCANRDLAPVRALLFARGGPTEVIDCGAPFEDPSVRACVVVDCPARRAATLTLGDMDRHGSLSERELPLELLKLLPDTPLTSCIRAEDVELFRALSATPRHLEDYVDIVRGMECGKNDPHVTRHRSRGSVPVISGEGVRPFQVRPQGLYVRLGLTPPSRYKAPDLFLAAPKLLLRFVASYPIAAVDEVGIADFNTVYNAYPKNGLATDLCYALACVLNSRIVRWWFTMAYNSDEGLFPHIQKYQLCRVPMPHLDPTASVWKRLADLGKRLTRNARTLDQGEVDSLVASAYGLPQVPAVILGLSGGPH